MSGLLRDATVLRDRVNGLADSPYQAISQLPDIARFLARLVYEQSVQIATMQNQILLLQKDGERENAKVD